MCASITPLTIATVTIATLTIATLSITTTTIATLTKMCLNLPILCCGKLLAPGQVVFLFDQCFLLVCIVWILMVTHCVCC